MPQQQPQTAAGGVGGILTRKVGPLPMWAWLGGGLALVLLVMYYRSSRAGTTAAEAPSSDVGDGQQSGQPIFILPPTNTPTVIVNPVETVPTAPPGGGRPAPPRRPIPGRSGESAPTQPTKRPPVTPGSNVSPATSTTVTPRQATPADIARIINARRG